MSLENSLSVAVLALMFVSLFFGILALVQYSVTTPGDDESPESSRARIVGRNILGLVCLTSFSLAVLALVYRVVLYCKKINRTRRLSGQGVSFSSRSSSEDEDGTERRLASQRRPNIGPSGRGDPYGSLQEMYGYEFY